MKLLRYQNFIKESKEYIDSICKKYNIQNYTINEDLSIDVNGNVDLQYMKLTELPLKFRKVSGYFDCSHNKLTSLSGSPKEVGGDFICHINELGSLIYSPKKIGGDYICNNNNLSSLEGCPNIVKGRSYFQYNKLRDFKGFPDEQCIELFFHANPVYDIIKLFPHLRRSEAIEYLNEFDVIRDGKVVILQRLEQVFIEMGLEVPEIDEIKGYQIQY